MGSPVDDFDKYINKYRRPLTLGHPFVHVEVGLGKLDHVEVLLLLWLGVALPLELLQLLQLALDALPAPLIPFVLLLRDLAGRGEECVELQIGGGTGRRQQRLRFSGTAMCFLFI